MHINGPAAQSFAAIQQFPLGRQTASPFRFGPMRTDRPAILALEDGTVFHGTAFGAEKTISGECVFNTSMTGYQEIITDPSYFGQIVTMTAVQIGNYGTNAADAEASGPRCSGLVVREISPIASNWRSELPLDQYLRNHGVPGISDIDTRAVTKRLRVDGSMKCCLSTIPIAESEAVKLARAWRDMSGTDYVGEVSCPEPFVWEADKLSNHNEAYSPAGTNLNPHSGEKTRFRVAAFDLGAKYSIYRKLVRHGFEVCVFPATTPAERILEQQPDALFLSNGPGDPSAVDYVHRTVSSLLPKLPTFGICLGHQMITHALGGRTFKLKFGHRGGNQPVKNLETGKVSITSQNHGFASDPDSLKKSGAVVTEINLNDQTVEGLRHRELPVFCVQYHPEAAPGPNDADPLFSDFYRLVEARKAGKI
jgi:carbamoyl-phosphate synthase small subunit